VTGDNRGNREVGGAVDVVLVTGRVMPKSDPESHLLVAALEKLGIEVAVRPWDDFTDWAAVPLVVVRTPWDYATWRAQFVEWAQGVAAVTTLVNPAPVLEWNSHKSYLLDLQGAGVPVIATTLVRRHASHSERVRALARYLDEIVIKPAVSVGAIGALRTTGGSDEAAEHLGVLSATGDVLVQPMATAVVDEGETSLIYFDCEFSHAVRKIPAAGDYRVQQHHGGRVVVHEPSRAELAVGKVALDAALEAAPDAAQGRLTYARVDVVRVEAGPAVMEVELIEPELFFRYVPEAAPRFAAHLGTMLRALGR
jgi:glutathione synthase/RimK-type ligase-like ATP-grasp enzyme